MKQRGILWNGLRKAAAIFVLAALMAGVGPVQAQTENPPEALEAPQDSKACLPDMYEPNEWFGEATLVDPNVSLQATLCGPGDIDVYAVDLTAGQELVVNMVYPKLADDPIIYIKDGQQAFLRPQYTNDDIYNAPTQNPVNRLYSFVPKRSGRYYIHIVSTWESGSANYTLHLSTICKALITEAENTSKGNTLVAAPAGSCDKGPGVYQPGTQVQLQLNPGKDQVFLRWNRALTGTDNPSSLIINQTGSVLALAAAADNAFSCDTVGNLSIKNCEALLSLYNATDGDHWTRSRGWFYDNDACTWDGVKCLSERRLDLRSNGLKGNLPTQFYLLSNFPHIDLGENQLGPTLSENFVKIPRLRTLRLDHNRFSGTVPTRIKNLQYLSTLDLSYNQLTGPLPLTDSDWPVLNYLNLAGNQFTGGIPSDISAHAPTLIELDISYNRLTGPIPNGVTYLEELDRLQAHHNQLTGSIPDGFCDGGHHYYPLSYLDLQSNRLSGPLPDCLAAIELVSLRLANNNFSGPLPNTWDLDEDELVDLDLSNNDFSGEIPKSLAFYFDRSTQVRLDGNRLTASNPDTRLLLAWKNPSWVSSQRVPMLQASLTHQDISAWYFPANTDLTLTIRDALDAQLFQVTAPTDTLGHLSLPFSQHQIVLAPGMTVEASDGVTTKSLTLTPLTLDAVDLPAQQVTGTAQPGDLVQVLADNLSQYDRLQTLADGSGSWDSSDSSWLTSTFGETAQPTEDLLLLPDTRVSARVYDADGDVTYVQQPLCLQLTTQVSPPETGSVNITTPANCPNGFLEGSTVALEAVPNPGFKFERWNGAVDDPSQPVTQITLEDNALVTASFVEGVPPTVLKLNSFRPTADQQITPGEVITNLPITQLMVHFSEPMDNPSGDRIYPGDVTNPDAYRLTRSGQPVTVNLVVYDAANLAAKLLLNGGKALESGAYTFEIPEGWLKDTQQNIFDGDSDGLPGGVFKLDFALSNIPSAPKLVAPLSRAFLNDTTPTFEWIPGLTDKAYTLQVARDAAFKNLIGTYVSPSSTFSLPDGDALSEGRYFWRAFANNPFDMPGKWSQVWSFTVDTTAPPAPLLRSLKDNSNTADTTPRLTWARSSGAKSYRLLLSDDPSFSRILADTTTLKTAYVFSDAETLPYGRYYWQVQAVDAAGNISPWSDPFSFDVSLLISPVGGSFSTQTAPTLRWARLSSASSYFVEVSRSPYFSSGSQVLFASIPAAVTRWNMGSLPYGWYYWRMSAVVEGVATPWMPTESFAVTPSLGQPTLTSPANKAILSNPAVELVWQEAAWGGYQAPVYQVQVDDTSNFSSPLHDVTLPADALSWVTPNLANGKHYWRVRAVNGLGYAGPWSASGNFTVLAP